MRFKVYKNQNKHGGARPTSYNFISAKFSKLFALSVIFNFENIHPSGSFEEKHPFKSLCWNVNDNCDVDVAIDHAGYQSKKQQENTTFRVFFVLCTWLVSPPGIYGTCFLPLTLLTTTAKRKTLFVFIHVELQALLIGGPPSRVRKV